MDRDIKLSVDNVVISTTSDGDFILLIKRKNEPFKDQWALPGGFVEYGEGLKTAAARELEEETGLVAEKLRQIAAFGEPDRDPRHHTVSIAYLVTIPNIEMRTAKGGADASEAKWFPVEELPALGFDHDIIFSAGYRLFKENRPL